MADRRQPYPSSPSPSSMLHRRTIARAPSALGVPDKDPIQEEDESVEKEPEHDKQHTPSWLWRTLSDVTSGEWDILVVSTVIKLLLFPAYRSTDFEVHRNWLAITHSLPISKWYFDTTSEWTLDYPPFFAYFEWILSIPASFVDKRIVDLSNLNYDAWSVITYQRTTVILTELVLGAAVLRFIRGSTDPYTQRIISASLFLHPGFLIVDHIHFQYNGFMFGILLWSILMARNGDRLGSGLFFAILLNFKHIYMYQAPAYFVYLLRSFCMSPQGELILPRFLSLANLVIAVFVLSFGPFLMMGQVPQVLSRLFPFKRGLNHAYWAPNAWALLTFVDRVALKAAQITGIQLPVNPDGIASTSRGLVGDTVFAIFPNIKPIHTFLVTLAFQSVYMVKLSRTPTYKSFLAALTLCGFTSFMFGWHVHEKAILLVLVPLSLLATENYPLFRTFLLASVAGIYSLFPLLFTPAETFVKIVYSAVWMFLVFRPLMRRLYEYPTTLPGVIIEWLERLYIAGFVPLQVFVTLFPVVAPTLFPPSLDQTIPDESAYGPTPSPAAAGNVTAAAVEHDISRGAVAASAMEFLPLMLTSIYCAIGLIWSFVRLSVIYLRDF